MKKGFSLIETLIVIGIVMILIVVPFTIWRGKNNHIVFEQTKTDIILALEKARSRAATGFGYDDHGVRIENNKLVIFEKNCADCGDIEFSLPLSVNLAAVNFPIIFDRINAQTESDAEIDISDATGEIAKIFIKKDGTIISQ